MIPEPKFDGEIEFRPRRPVLGSPENLNIKDGKGMSENCEAVIKVLFAAYKLHTIRLACFPHSACNSLYVLISSHAYPHATSHLENIGHHDVERRLTPAFVDGELAGDVLHQTWRGNGQSEIRNPSQYSCYGDASCEAQIKASRGNGNDARKMTIKATPGSKLGSRVLARPRGNVIKDDPRLRQHLEGNTINNQNP